MQVLGRENPRREMKVKVSSADSGGMGPRLGGVLAPSTDLDIFG